MFDTFKTPVILVPWTTLANVAAKRRRVDVEGVIGFDPVPRLINNKELPGATHNKRLIVHNRRHTNESMQRQEQIQ